MKKRIVGLLLSLVFAFGLVGCGNSAEQKQETNAGADQEVDAGTEQEEKKDIETDNFVFLAEVGEQEYILESFEWEEASVEFTTKYETNIYNIEGRNIGYIKPDVSVEITEHGINSGWYRFKNPEDGTDYEYLCVLRDDVEAQGGEAPQVQDENGVIDTEMMWIYPEDYEYGNDKEISPDLIWTECNVEFTNKDVLQLYNDDGKNVAWLHNLTVTFTEENEEWYRFKNTESNIDSEYLLVAKSSIESQNQYLEEQEEYTEQDKMYNEAIALFDENKTYTIDEYIEVITKMLEVLGKKSNAEVASDFEEYIKNKKSFDEYWVQQVSHVFDFENIEDTLENTEALLNLLQYGKDGRGGITEFYIVKGESSGQEAVVIYYKTEAAAMEN